MSAEDTPVLLRYSAAGRLIGKTRNQVRNMVRRGELECVTMKQTGCGLNRAIPLNELRKWIGEHPEASARL